MSHSTSPILSDIRSHCHERSTGLFGLTSADGERVEVSFREGLIEAVSVADANPDSFLNSRHLGDYMAEDLGLSVQEILAIQSEARKRGLVFGEAALRRGVVDETRLHATVRRQSLELLQYILRNGSSAGAFAKASPSSRSFRIPAGVRLEHLLLELARSEATPYRGEGTHCFTLCDEDVSEYPWLPKELCVLAELTRPRDFSSLRSLIRMDEVSLRRILGVLFHVGVLIDLDLPEMSQSDDRVRGDQALVDRTRFDLERLVPITRAPRLNERLEVARSRSSFTSEQFKNLKVQLSEISGPGHKVYAVSSPAAGDGKSLVSMGLAFSFAMDPNRKVLVLDCDMRSPAVDRYLGVPQEPGVLQYVANGYAGPHCYLRRVENLYFLAAGGVAPNPVEILSMEKMKGLIASLRQDFDTIILDAPPYSPIADARLITTLSDGLILVVRRGRTAFSATERALKAIDPNKLLGIVLNDVKPMLFHTYESYPYYGFGERPIYPDRNLNPGKPPKTYLDS